ncbi:MAG: ATP synthase subunit C family protein [Alphaproteobacteria bacterium]
MDVEAAKLIGGGLATIGLAGVGVGIGNIFASMIASSARNPAAIPQVQLFMWVGFALVEAVALYALLIAFLILFG